MTTFRYTPVVTATVISQVADGTAASAVLNRIGLQSPATMTSDTVNYLRGCAAAMPNEPLFPQLITLITQNGTITVTWS